jgi:outer membrane protein assembly factor BamA
MVVFNSPARGRALSVVSLSRVMVILAVLVFAGAGISPLSATDLAGEDSVAGLTAGELAGVPVQTIAIEGLRKTRESVVRDLIPVAAGDTFTTATVQSVTDALVDSDLFAEVGVTAIPAGDGAEIVVTVDEKWTIVPIPFVSTNGSSFDGGLILLESNLFGRNKQLISAGFAGSGGVRGFFLYVDPSVFGSSWSTSLNASTGRSDDSRERPDGVVLREYELDRQSVGFGVGYGLTPDLRVRSSLRYETWTIRIDDPRIGQTPLENDAFFEPGLSIAYDGTRAVDVLRVGPMVAAEGRYVTLDEGWETRGFASLGVPIAGTHRLRVLASGGLGDVPTLAEQTISGQDGYRTLPYNAVTADRWGSGAVLYDLPVLSGGWGALVISHYWEAGGYTNDEVDPRLFWGPGGGFRVYLRQVAIPALGLDLAYNIPDGGLVFSFTLGAQM